MQGVIAMMKHPAMMPYTAGNYDRLLLGLQLLSAAVICLWLPNHNCVQFVCRGCLRLLTGWMVMSVSFSVAAMLQEQAQQLTPHSNQVSGLPGCALFCFPDAARGSQHHRQVSYTYHVCLEESLAVHSSLNSGKICKQACHLQVSFSVTVVQVSQTLSST